MKMNLLKPLTSALVLILLLGLFISGSVEQIQPGYPKYIPTPEEMARWQAIPEWQPSTLKHSKALPSSIDNTSSIFFPPVINQKANSCSQAAGIGYVYTYEMNRMLNRPANIPENQFSYHYVWNFLNQGENRGSMPNLGYDLIRINGAATVADLDDQNSQVNDKTWMSGYDKYIRSMTYRAKAYYKFTLKTQDGIDRLKRYLFDRGENTPEGGIATFSCYADNWQPAYYPSSNPSQTHIEQMIVRVGTLGAHSLTIVGYDDLVEYDLNNDGLISDDEKGAFIVANTWGSGWGTDGKAYFPYRLFLLPANEGGLTNNDAEAVTVEPEIHEPRIVFKVKVTYTSRNDLYFTLGVADGKNATQPTITMVPAIFNFQGGDHYMKGGNSEEDKSIEVAFNFTDKWAEYQSFAWPKYFLNVHKVANGQVGSGTVDHFSVEDLATGKQYLFLKNEVPITGLTEISTGQGISASSFNWQYGNSTPRPFPYIVKTASGKQVKLQFTSYNKQKGTVQIRYQKL